MIVSRALRVDSPVRPDKRAHVLKMIDEMGYVPDEIAGGLSSQRSGFVAVLVPSLNNPHFADTVGAIGDVLAPSGLQILIGHTKYRPELEEKLIEAMLRRRPEMIALTYDGHTPRARRRLETVGVPVVEIWEKPARPIGHVVGFSNRRAARALTRHLISKGHRRIAFIGEYDDAGTRGALRRKGVIETLRACGLEADRRLAVAPPPITMTDGAAALSAILGKWPDTEAIIGASDLCAFGLLTERQRRGIDVPGAGSLPALAISRLAVARFPRSAQLAWMPLL